jgi:serine/threonine-protein kinase RsbW
MQIVFTLRLPRDETSVPAVRHICSDALDDLGVEEDDVSDVEIALTEACTNVLKHARGTPDEYEICIEIDPGSCEIRVRDMGSGFDAAEFGTSEVDHAEEGGRGIVIMRGLVDTIDFQSEPKEGFIVRLVKELTLSEGSVLRRLDEITAGPPAGLSDKEAERSSYTP